MVKRFGSTIRIIVALFLSSFSTNLMPVMTAHASTFTNHKVTICHATNSQSNPYTINYIDKSSVDEPNNQYLNGHGDHTGPVWYQGIADHSWGDIIPPFTYGNTSYPGQNWTTAGQAIYNNDCEVPDVNVTPTAPTKVDPCGHANDGYIITATNGVKYYKSVWGADPELSAGFHAEDDNVYIYAVAQDGYKIVGNDDWSFSFTNADCVATPAAPTKSDICGTQNDTYTIPTTEGVYYKVNGTTLAAGPYAGTGTVTIKAYAKSGYALSGTKEWTFTFSTAPCITTVTPTVPTNNEACGVQNDTYTIPAKTGVIYKVNDVATSAGTYNATGTVTIKAYAADATYVLSGDTEWTFTFDDTPCITTVTPTAPTSSEACGNFNDTYTIPSAAGVVYKVNGVVTPAGTYHQWMTPGVTSFDVTAEPAANYYVLAGQTSWTIDFTNLPCDTVTVDAPDTCVEHGKKDGEFTVDVKNDSSDPTTYQVLVDGSVADTALVAPNSSHSFVLSGYGPGTYSVEVLKVTLAGPVLPINLPGFPGIPGFPIDGPLQYLYKSVYTGSVTIPECPRGQVLGDSTDGGHILATSTDVPNVLPNTGASATNPWVTIVVAAISFLVAHEITRKKFLNDQI